MLNSRLIFFSMKRFYQGNWIDSMAFRFVDELPNDKNLLFICATGIRSGLACEMAAAMNIDTSRLFNIEEGTPSWIQKEYPTESG